LTRIVVVGCQSAGFTAASFARRTNRRAEVVIVEKRPYGLYHPCGIPLAVEGAVRPGDLLHTSSLPGVQLLLGREAVVVDTGSKVLRVREMKTGEESEIQYDSLIIATGGNPVRPKIPGIDLKGVHTVRTVEDCEMILNGISGVKRAAVIGGGAIGVELSLSLCRQGLDVVLFEQMPYPLPAMLDGDMAELVTDKLEAEGVKVVCGSRVSEIKGGNAVQALVSEGEEYPAEIVIMAVGVLPNSELARKSGIKIGTTGGIKIDERMRTSSENVFAAGECVEAVNLVTGEPALSFLASTAVAMGRVAGVNAAGGNARFKGVLNSTLVRVGNLFVGSTGLTSSSAEKSGIKTVSVRVRVADRPSYVPGSGWVTVKLLADAEGGNLIGGQIAGTFGISETLDLLSFAIRGRSTPEGLVNFEHSYMPWASDVMSPLQVAADALLRKMK